MAAHKNFMISEVSFSLQPGDILGIMGRSGSGKSTVLDTIVGLKKMFKGEIRLTINGRPSKLQEVIGLSPQENSLYPFLTLKENIFTFAHMHKIYKKDIEEQMHKLISRLDLKGSENKKIIQLSGGMQKRADLAVTLINSPKIIVLDEPFTGLDIALIDFIWNLLKELAKEGKIIIISSHLITDLEKNCNKLALVSNGKFYNDLEFHSKMKSSDKNNLKEFLEDLFKKDIEGR